jgi:hypothetical protein
MKTLMHSKKLKDYRNWAGWELFPARLVKVLNRTWE